MASRGSLRSNVLFSLLGQVSLAASQALALVVLAKSLDPAAVGLFALGLAVTGPWFRSTRRSLRVAIASDVVGAHSIVAYVRLALIVALVAAAASIAVAVAWGQPAGAILVVAALAGGVSLASISEVLYGACQRAGRFGLIATAQALRALLLLAGLAAGLLVDRSVLAASLGLLVAHGAGLVLIDLPFARSASASGGRSARDSGAIRAAGRHGGGLARVALVAAPLGLAAFLASATNNVPRYFVQHELGSHDMGVFAVIALPVLAAYAFLHSVGHAFLPRVADAHAGGHGARVLRLTVLACCGAVAVALCGVTIALLFGSQLLTILFRSDYAGYSGVLAWLFVGAMFAYPSWMLETTLSGARRFATQAWTMAASLVAAVVASALLVPAYGLTGAAWALGIAFATSFVLRAIAVARLTRTSRGFAPEPVPVAAGRGSREGPA